MDMKIICRTCLTEGGTMRSIFDPNDPMQISFMITLCTVTKVMETDGFPKHICEKCTNDVRVAYDFKKRCEDSYRKLKEVLIINDENVEDLVNKSQSTQTDFMELESSYDESCVIEHTIETVDNDNETEEKELLQSGELGDADNTNIVPIEDTKKVDAAESKYSCDECDACFKSEARFNFHKSRIHKIKTHICTTCGKVFTRATHLKRHMLTHSGDRPFPCNLCEKAFNRPDHLNLHLQKHNKNDTYSCDICLKKFRRADTLKHHKEVVHSENSTSGGGTGENRNCSVCQKDFSSAKYLQIHMRVHDESRLTCKYCKQVFESKVALNTHLKVEHINERPFLCSECGLRFVRHDYLNIHMRRHKGEKPYKCKFCGKGFPRATDLNVHERYHTDEKTHLCTICGKGFQRAYNLVVHMRVHTGERPYPCPHCDKRFAQGNDLKAHIRRHTGERLKCEICGEGFIQGYHLTHHKKSQHGVDIKSKIRRVEKFYKTDQPNNDEKLNDDLKTSSIYEVRNDSDDQLFSIIKIEPMEADVETNATHLIDSNQSLPSQSNVEPSVGTTSQIQRVQSSTIN